MATFICGATGTQGGSLASILLSQNKTVHCLTRDAASTKSQNLASRGAKLFVGSWEDPEVLAQALEGCTSVFMNLRPDYVDTTAELGWAKNILKTAGEKGVKHVIYSSALGSGDPMSLPGITPESIVGKFMVSKNNIEKEVRKGEHVPSWTILRPGWFMTNFLNPSAQMMAPGLISPNGTWKVAYHPKTRLPMIDSITMGNFAAAAISDPEKFRGKTISYCDEILPIEEVLEKLRKATGREELGIEFMDEEEVREQKAVSPFVQGQVASRDLGGMVDMEEVRGYGVVLSSFDGFLEREKAAIAKTFGVAV